MIPTMNIVAWGAIAPWPEQRQVEQDLIISRVIIELFGDPFLAEELRCRGGTALNKLHFPQPIRYSEDIDLVRTTNGPLGPILGRIRDTLEPWLGRASFDQSKVAPKLRFRAEAEDRPSTAALRVKVEINTRETEAYDAPLSVAYRVENPWFTGESVVRTYSREEMLGTKLRALLQRNEGRDLFDLSHGLTVFDKLDTARVVECCLHYMKRAKTHILRAEAEQRMFLKLSHRGVLADIRPLLSAGEAKQLTAEAMKTAFSEIFTRLITRLPGKQWAKTEEMAERYGLRLS